VITYATTMMGLPLYEHYVAEGKRHALYGSLAEIRTMAVECLDAVRSLRGRPSPVIELASDPSTAVPDDLKATVGYDLEKSMGLLVSDWVDGEPELAASLPQPLAREVLRNRDEPWFEFMGAAEWGEVLAHLLDHFALGHAAWQSLAFRLWLIRVLSYTTSEATRGYDHAIDYLEGTIAAYEAGAAGA
jgi:mannosylglycerate synthase